MEVERQRVFIPRPVRVSVPVRVDFRSERFRIQEFTANLSEGGIFLLTEHTVPIGASGRLTFRISPWDPAFTVEAEVVRAVLPDGPPEDGPAGLGIRFRNLSDADRNSLQRIVEGVQDGSVVEAIRRSLRESPHGLEQELRRRSVDQKMMLAICAKLEEIDVLIRDGNPSVLQRLLENPRIGIQHVRAIVRDPRVPAPLLLHIKRQPAWFRDEEVRWSFCRHPKAPFLEARRVLESLSVPRLQQIAADGHVRMNVRGLARDILARKRRS